MSRPEALRDATRVLGFGVRCDVEPDGKGLQIAVSRRGERDQRARVDAAREKEPDGHVGHELLIDGPRGELAELGRGVVGIDGSRLDRKRPERRLGCDPTGAYIELERRRRRELACLAVPGLRRGSGFSQSADMPRIPCPDTALRVP